MIPTFQAPWEPEAWKQIMRRAVRSASSLLNELGLSASGVDLDPEFKVRVPEPFLRRIRPNTPNDPLLLQVLPQLVERESRPGFSSDALAEADFIRAPALLQKYKGRALLVTTQACAVHCRYCFRRNFAYDEHRPSAHQAALDAIAADTSVVEVILSGGDPLSLDDAVLGQLLLRLDEINHIKRIRLHTRLPIMIPQRVTETLVTTLSQLRANVVVVAHSNHANELDAATARAFAALANGGATLLNQAVILRGVNDAWQQQAALAEALFDQRVLPYYLHASDRVTGTQHFFVEDERAAEIMQELHAHLPGYLVPRLVREIPGRSGKTPIFWTT